MPLTMLEAAKRETGSAVRQGVIELFPESSEILRILPFANIQGNALAYNREESLPGVSFRGVNEAYPESSGILNPQIEKLSILGGDFDIDNFIIQTMGEENKTSQIAMKAKAMAGEFTRAFIQGDNESEVREMSGLQQRIQNDQLLSAGTTANGAALSLYKLDELIDQVDRPSALIMNSTLKRRFAQAARNGDVSGYLTYDKDEFGFRILRYGDIELIDSGKDNFSNDILAFDEAAASGTATATSIYCISTEDDGVVGIQNGGIMTSGLGELDDKPTDRSRMEWYVGLAIFKGQAAARLQHIGNLPFVA